MSTEINSKYISFIGYVILPSDEKIEELNFLFPPVVSEVLLGYDTNDEPVYQDYNEGFRDGLDYGEIAHKDSLTIYLCKVEDGIGHLVADCSPGGWISDTFVMLDSSGNIIKDEKNYNPNPIEQII